MMVPSKEWMGRMRYTSFSFNHLGSDSELSSRSGFSSGSDLSSSCILSTKSKKISSSCESMVIYI